MNRFVPNKKCVVFCLLSLALRTVPAFGGTGAEVPKPTDAGRAIKAAEDRRAYEAYEKRNAEITPWMEDCAPPNPGNAALLYYQAFLLRPEPNDAMQYEIYPDTEPTRQIRAYMGHCLPVIEIVEIASRMPGCIWGVWPERRLSLVALRREIGRIENILLVDAKTLAVDGHYHVALERCLIVRRLARHLSDDPELYIYATGFDKPALYKIRDVLGVMPPDVETLMWLRGQLAVVQVLSRPFGEVLKARAGRLLDHVRTTPVSLSFYKNLVVEEVEGERAKEDARNLTDEQFLSIARKGLQCFTDSVLRILDSEMPYEKKIAQIDRFFDEPLEDDSNDLLVEAVISAMTPTIGGEVTRGYPFRVVHEAHVNGVKAAVEVYLEVAKTGNLPEKLPDHLPKDPFTGRDFIYEITNEGFALRCQSEGFPMYMNKWLEFKVQK